MFTGIIEELGIIASLEKKGLSAVLSVKANKVYSDAAAGDSISVNGVCLTAVAKNAGILKFDVSKETLDRSNIGNLNSGDKVNLERALKADSRIGGHFVTGHIDCVTKIRHKDKSDDTAKIKFEAGPDFLKYIALKGSVAIDGISLTVAEINKNYFAVCIIPHTVANTTLGFKKQGDTVNIEFDILAKYVEKSLISKESPDITAEFLSEHGFI